MKVTVEIDDELVARALEVSGTRMELDRVVEEALQVYLEVEAGRRLADLGGKGRDTKDVPRRRF